MLSLRETYSHGVRVQSRDLARPANTTCDLNRANEEIRLTRVHGPRIIGWRGWSASLSPSPELEAIIGDDGDSLLHIAVITEDLHLVSEYASRLCSSSAPEPGAAHSHQPPGKQWRLPQRKGSPEQKPFSHHSLRAIDCFNHLRQTALHLAVCIGNEEIIRILLEMGASIHLVDRNGNNVLHLAVTYARVKSLALLLRFIAHSSLSEPDKAALLDGLNFEGLSPLHVAVSSSWLARDTQVEAAALLVATGADINVRDGLSGRTPLMFVLKHSRVCRVAPQHDEGGHLADSDSQNTFIRILLSLGADTYIPDYSESRPVDYIGTENSRFALTL